MDDFLKQVLVGGLLGDVHMRRFSPNANTRVVFRQGDINSEYLLHLYELFQKYVSSPPTITSIMNKSSGKIRYNLSFATLALPCFNELYEEFYIEGKKLVPSNITYYPR